MSMTRLISKVTAPITRRVRLLARRAVVKLVYDDPKMQDLQLAIFAGEVRDRVERFQDYGFTSHPHTGAEAIVLALGGSSDHSVAIKVDDRRYRLTALAAGEVALYTDEGDTIVFKRGKIIDISTDTLRINAATLCEINTANMQINASAGVTAATPQLLATGDIKDRSASGGATMANARTVFNGHDHPGDSGGTTGTPNQQM